MTRRSWWSRAATGFAIPSLLYFALYAVMNPYAWRGFSRHFLLDAYDGYQNVWNVWWVRHSVVDLHSSPYFTHSLHWPAGVTLVPQTMNPLNGLAGIALQGVGLGLAPTVNTIVIASFVATGLTTFWLLRHLESSYGAALLGGLLFTFSSFHEAHAIGHLQLIALEFVPLFVLAWLRYLVVPTHGRAATAGAVLFAVILCDYYYACYCLGIAAILFGAHVLRRRRSREVVPWRTLTTFVVVSAATSGVLLGALLATNRHDPLLGAHHAVFYGLDPVSLVVPGGASYWSSLTRGYWHRLLPIAISETSVFLGSVLLIGLLASIVLRRRLRLSASAAWWIVLAVFATLALGPRLHFDGVLHPAVPLPYALFERIVPGFKLSGMPMRMTVVVVLAAVVIVSDLVTALQRHIRRPPLRWLLVGALAAVSVVELYPRPVTRATTTYPPYVAVLRTLPHDVGVVDAAAPSAAAALYDQTGDGMPMAYGYVTRLPTSVDHIDRAVAGALRAGDYTELCTRFRLRYLVTHHTERGLRVVYHDPGRVPVWIYDLQRATPCATPA